MYLVQNTLHKQLKELPPGHYITKKENEEMNITKYWQGWILDAVTEYWNE